MKKSRRLFERTARIEICAHMPERFLNFCLKDGIDILCAKRKDELTHLIFLHPSDLTRAREIAEAKGFELRVIRNGRERRVFFRRRIIGALVAFMIVLLLFWSKFYVWEISISGNEKVSAGEILNALNECGVKSGAFWPAFSSDMIRNEILSNIPELSWISVNMRGSRAEVNIVERREKPEMVFEEEEGGIVAKKEGFVRSVNVLAGRALVKSGNIVSKGDVLISGILQSSFAQSSFTKALGSVKAETDSSYMAVYPAQSAFRSYSGKEKHNFALIIGDNRINFYSDSSISHEFYDKIISVWDLEISGVFRLPVSIVEESFYAYETNVADSDEFETGRQLERCVYEVFQMELDDGELLSDKLRLSHHEGLYVAELRVRCIEEIGISAPISDEEKYAEFTEKANEE